MTNPATIGQRIQRLRVANGLSQTDLATAIGVANGAVSMIENGRQAADDAVLASIAQVLDCDATYFTRSPREVVNNPPWLRAYADAPKRAVDRYIEDTHAAIEVIEQGALKSMPEVIPTYDDDLNNDQAIEDFARQVRHAARLDEGEVVGNVIRAAERLGCVVLPMDDELGRHMGMSMRANAFPVIRVSRPHFTKEGPVMPAGDRQRFTVAHEIGHLALHSAYPPPATADESALFEKQAHRFAGAFLAPADPLLEDLDDIGGRVTLSTLQELKGRWGVAIKMLVVRVRQLGRIDDHQARSLYKQISARKWNKVEPIHVGHEEAIWLDRALTKAYTRNQSQDVSPLQMAASHNGLGRAYFDRWVDWSPKQYAVENSADVVPLIARTQGRKTVNSTKSAKITRLTPR